MLDPSAAARTSYRENMKHVCVGESLAIRPDGSVLVSGTFSEEDVLALAHRTMDEIEGWVQGYCDVDRRSKQPRLLVRPVPFERNLNFTGGRFERLGVRLNKKNVIDLIASNAVWRDNRGVAIRELVQNAVEACRYRAHHSSSADAYAFLTTEPNAEVGAVHPKAMPVILTTPEEEVETWMTAPPDEAPEAAAAASGRDTPDRSPRRQGGPGAGCLIRGSSRELAISAADAQAGKGFPAPLVLRAYSVRVAYQVRLG